MYRFPFGRPATRRPPRVPEAGCRLVVLGVYPSALHVRWAVPDRAEVVGALAVDDEPTVFWDGADAGERIEAWKADVGWSDAWGRVGLAGGNGSSGRHVVTHVLEPLGVSASATWFTDCLPTYFVKNGPGSQGERLQKVYRRFADEVGLEPAVLPVRPSPGELVRRAIAEEATTLVGQLVSADCSRVVTLGQEAADVLAAITSAHSAKPPVGDRVAGTSGCQGQEAA